MILLTLNNNRRIVDVTESNSVTLDNSGFIQSWPSFMALF